MHRVRNKLTYANVVASLALFLVLSGATAYAASHLGRNSVGAKQLKSSAVTTSKLKRNAVTATKIRLGSITAAKIEKGAVSGAKLSDGAVTGAKINEGAVTGTKIGDGAVTGAKIKDGAISTQQLGAQSVGNSQTQLVKVFKAGAVAAAPSEAAAPRVELGSVGPFHFYAKCFHGQTAVIEQSYIELTSGVATLGTTCPDLSEGRRLSDPGPAGERAGVGQKRSRTRLDRANLRHYLRGGGERRHDHQRNRRRRRCQAGRRRCRQRTLPRRRLLHRRQHGGLRRQMISGRDPGYA